MPQLRDHRKVAVLPAGADENQPAHTPPSATRHVFLLYSLLAEPLQTSHSDQHMAARQVDCEYNETRPHSYSQPPPSHGTYAMPHHRGGRDSSVAPQHTPHAAMSRRCPAWRLD